MTSYDHTAKVVEDLYREYGSYVYRLAMSSTHNRLEAEDIRQEVFLRVFKYWHNFRGEASPKTWIANITYNCIADAARKKLREQKRLNLYKDHYSYCFDTLVEIEDVFEALSPQQTQVVKLRIIKDLSVRDTAQLLGCSEGKVRMDTYHALHRLRQSAIVL